MPELSLLGPELTELLRRAERRAFRVVRHLRAGRMRQVRVEELELMSSVGYRLKAKLWLPELVSEPCAGLVLLGDGDSGIAAAVDAVAPLTAPELAHAGWAVVALDLAGRGGSLGEDDHGGAEHADDVRCAVSWLAERPEVDAARIGLVGLGLGAPVAVAGAAAGAEVAWVLDWEGPVDRETLLSVHPEASLGVDDATWWSDRDTLRQLAELRCGYVRMQSEDDHLNPEELRHAQRALFTLAHSSRSASAWFQINDHPRGDAPARPQWLPGGRVMARRALLRKLRRLSAERRSLG